MTVKLPSEQHLEFLSFTGGCTGSSESIHVRMPHCWTSHVTAYFVSSEAIDQISKQGYSHYLTFCQSSEKELDLFMVVMVKDGFLSKLLKKI